MGIFNALSKSSQKHIASLVKENKKRQAGTTENEIEQLETKKESLKNQIENLIKQVEEARAQKKTVMDKIKSIKPSKIEVSEEECEAMAVKVFAAASN